jgi:RNA recognition motif-containing protein
MAGLPPPPPSFGAPMDQSNAEEAPPLPADAGKTLYIQNLNEKVKLETMKATLANLFSNYANVLSVTSHNNVRMRGQAFVALDSVEAADKARREAHLFPLYGKAMKISFAKSKSDAVVAQETAESGGKESDDFQKHKEQRLEHKKMARRGNVLRRRELEKKIRAKRAAAGEIAEPEKASGAAAKRAQHDMPDEYLPPNKMLFLQKIPDGVGKGELESLFSAYVSIHPMARLCFVDANPPFWFCSADTLAMWMCKPSRARPTLPSSSFPTFPPASRRAARSTATTLAPATNSRCVLPSVCIGFIARY